PFNGELGLTVGELSQPGAHLGSRCRRDPTAAQLARLSIKRLEGDLVSVHLKRDYDPHRDLLDLRQQDTACLPRFSRGGLTACRHSSTEGVTAQARVRSGLADSVEPLWSRVLLVGPGFRLRSAQN